MRPEDVGYDQARPLSLVTITFVMNMNMVLVKGQRPELARPFSLL